MKDTDITISFNSEKLDALNFYMSKKESDVQQELEETVQGLYLKHVPAPTREYIEDRLERDGTTSPSTKASKKAVATSKKNSKKDKKDDKREGSKDTSSADSLEEASEDADSSASSQTNHDTENQSTQDTMDELLNGSADGTGASGEGDYGNSSEDGFLDGLLS